MTIEIKNNGEPVGTIVTENDGEPEAYMSTTDNDGNVVTHDLTPGEVDMDTKDSAYSALHAVRHALEGKPLEFEAEIQKGIALRLQDNVERKRDEVAQSIFGVENPEVETDDSSTEEEPTSEAEPVETEEEEETPTEE